MKKIAIILLVLIFLFSCKKNVTKENDDDARNLFMNTSKLLLELTSELKNSQDSLQVDSLMNLFEHKMIEINFSVPPETDLKLTEEENDSIFKLMNNLKNLQIEMLETFSRIHNDSVFNNGEQV